ncbi:amino acid aminotransferase [Sphingosinicella xenopeptidilytica]|uniref:Aminotransferase n=1 Tax=Sphingosinicella xenopeptidilytica TaxID=364098 RepID=A0ABW3C5N2_SPHXN
MFSDLAAPKADPILGLTKLFADDTSPDKVDLGIGVYKDEAGEVPVLATVKAAERWLAETQTSKRYLSSAGNDAFNSATRALLFGAGTDAFTRSRTVQAPGGTGALRLGMDFLRVARPGGRVFVPTPTWTNHGHLLAAAGCEIVHYPYYDVATGNLRFDEMMEALRGLTEKDVLLLHGCCHNPSGADPDAEGWKAIAETLERSGALPFVDLAYLGFAEGLEEDAHSVRLLAQRLPEVVIASSYSKNFALYRDRVGALTIVGTNAADSDRAHAHLMPLARALWSMPPDHGAAVVAHVLQDKALAADWRRELAEMRTRINTVRAALVKHLAGAPRDYAFLGHQRGMFALLGLSPDAVRTLREEHHVHMTGTSRANVAGLNMANVERVATAIASVSDL